VPKSPVVLRKKSRAELKSMSKSARKAHLKRRNTIIRRAVYSGEGWRWSTSRRGTKWTKTGGSKGLGKSALKWNPSKGRAVSIKKQSRMKSLRAGTASSSRFTAAQQRAMFDVDRSGKLKPRARRFMSALVSVKRTTCKKLGKVYNPESGKCRDRIVRTNYKRSKSKGKGKGKKTNGKGKKAKKTNGKGKAKKSKKTKKSKANAFAVAVKKESNTAKASSNVAVQAAQVAQSAAAVAKSSASAAKTASKKASKNAAVVKNTASPRRSLRMRNGGR